jgi:hypothetical protein
MKIDTALYTIKRKMTFYFLEAACLSMVPTYSEHKEDPKPYHQINPP